MFDRWREARAEDEELNLIPVMNLMVTLIPFLLLGAAFYHLGVVPASIPENVPASDSEPPKEIKVTVNLSLQMDKAVVSGSAMGLDEEATAALDATFPSKNGVPDLKALQAHLYGIRTQYPKSDTVILLPADELRYEKLIEILDFVRERKTGKSGPDGDIVEQLFPVTVFSKLLVAEEGAGGSEGVTE